MEDKFAVYTRNLADLKGKKDRAEAEFEAIKAEYNDCAEKLLKLFEATETQSLTAHGFTFYIHSEETVTTPKTPEEKEQLFSFLKDRGIYDDMISVNSKTLQTLYRTCAKEALEKGVVEFRLPGCGEPNEKSSIRLRRK
jgi:hypothetical protein